VLVVNGELKRTSAKMEERKGRPSELIAEAGETHWGPALVMMGRKTGSGAWAGKRNETPHPATRPQNDGSWRRGESGNYNIFKIQKKTRANEWYQILEIWRNREAH